MKMFHWEKLSPDEFKQFQEYISESNKNLIDASKEFKEHLGKDEDSKRDILVDYSGFSRFMTIYIEPSIPDGLCRRLFVSFLKKPHSSSAKNHGYLSRSDSNSVVSSDKNAVRKSMHSPSSSVSEPTEIRLMTNFVERRKSLLRRKSADGITGMISLKDLICCLSLLEAGKPENKLEFLFRLYDTDGNGILDAVEIDSIINQMMTVAKYSGWDVSELKPILQEMMQEVDYNADGCVTLEEWMKAGSSNIPLMVLLGVDSVFNDEGSHSWELKHFNRPAFCNYCQNLLVGLGKQGLRCIYCRYTAHERCVKKVEQSCITTYSKSKIVQPMTHFWVEGNCAGKCDKCKKFIKAYNRLTGRKCRWCKMAVHTRCAPQVAEECTMGPCKEHILSPSQISPTVLNRKLRSKFSMEPSSSSASLDDISNSSFNSLQLVPLPDVIPLLVFINPKSGGKQGKSLLKKFQYMLNPRQVFNVATDKGFINGLQFFKELPEYRILCCGGDGTVGWLLESMDKININIKSRPPVSILPLGTGNDLARSLRWGGGYEGEDLYKILEHISHSSVVMVDRWLMEIKPSEAETASSNEHSKVPCNIINNYFSIGVDASIAHRFHVMREKHPEKFNSRMRNKLIYLEYGTSETLRATCKNLHESVQITCDGVPLDLIRGPSMEGIALLNISNIYGGSNLWGEMKMKKRKKAAGEVDRECSSGSMSSADLSVTAQNMGDKLIEVVGLMNTLHMARVKGGIHSGERLAQCSSVTIQTLKEFPMQIDGEPWIQPPCTLTIKHKNQVPMLNAPKNSRKSHFFSFFSTK